MPDCPTDLAQLKAVIDRVMRTIDAREDPHAAYAAATAAGLLGRVLIDATAAARGRALVKIRETEELSIGQLATLMDMSKTRVQQLMNHAEKGPR